MLAPTFNFSPLSVCVHTVIKLEVSGLALKNNICHCSFLFNIVRNTFKVHTVADSRNLRGRGEKV